MTVPPAPPLSPTLKPTSASSSLTVYEDCLEEVCDTLEVSNADTDPPSAPQEGMAPPHAFFPSSLAKSDSKTSINLSEIQDQDRVDTSSLKMLKEAPSSISSTDLAEPSEARPIQAADPVKAAYDIWHELLTTEPIPSLQTAQAGYKYTLQKSLAAINKLCESDAQLKALKEKNEKGPLYQSLVEIMQTAPRKRKRGNFEKIIELILLRDLSHPKLTAQDWIALELGNSQNFKNAISGRTEMNLQFSSSSAPSVLSNNAESSLLTNLPSFILVKKGVLDDRYGKFLLCNIVRFMCQNETPKTECILRIPVENIDEITREYNLFNPKSDPTTLDPIYIAFTDKIKADIFSNLLEAGMDAFTLDSDNQSALHRLMQIEKRNYAETVRNIISNGVDINQQSNKSRSTPLHFALDTDLVHSATVLAQHGTNPNLKNVWGYTPVHLAAHRGYTEIVQILQKNGADLSCQDTRNGDTPLHFAIRQSKDTSHIETIETLILASTDKELSIKNENECTPERLAFVSDKGNVFSLFYKKIRFNPWTNKEHREILKEAKKYGLHGIIKSIKKMMAPKGFGWFGSLYSAFSVWYLA